MKVLQINCVYGTGSTGKITGDIHENLLKDGFESVVIYGRGKRVDMPHVIRVCNDLYAKTNNVLSRFTGLKYGGCLVSTDKMIHIIQAQKPDVVHLQCINGYFLNIYKLIEWLKNHRYPAVLTLHAEFMFTANCDHAFDCDGWLNACGNCPQLYKATKSLFFDRTHASFEKMRRAFEGYHDLDVVSVSPWLEQRASASPILRNHRHHVIYNGVNTDIFCPHQTLGLEKQLGIGSRKIILYVTAFFKDKMEDPKGGWYLLRLAERMLSDQVLFLVAGKYEVCTELPDNILLLGNVQDQYMLAELYSLADLTVITSRRETYSMVCAESLCCGTPVVGFQAGGPESISLKQYSEFVAQGDLDALERCVRHWLLLKETCCKDEVRLTAMQVYDRRIMVEKYEELYRRI